MALAGYGLFGKLPREIRDMVYQQYFSADNPAVLAKHLETNKSEPVLCVREPDLCLLRVSSALHGEAKPFWEKCWRGRRLFRIVTTVSTAQPAKKEMFLTVAADSLPRAPPFTPGMHLRWLSYRWLNNHQLFNPQFSRTAKCKLEGVRLVLPNLKYFFQAGNIEIDGTMELFAKALKACSRSVLRRMNIFVEDAKWPLPLPGENIWYQRLHEGMTRRSLKKSREGPLNIVVKQMSDLILRFQKIVGTVTFTFHKVRRYGHNLYAGQINDVVLSLRQRVPGIMISVEYD